MKTVSKYQATLTYKRSVYIEGGSDRKIHVGTKSQYQRICNVSSTEEVLYTIREYENTAEDLGMRLPAYIKSFLALLNTGLRVTVKNLIRDRSPRQLCGHSRGPHIHPTCSGTNGMGPIQELISGKLFQGSANKRQPDPNVRRLQNIYQANRRVRARP